MFQIQTPRLTLRDLIRDDWQVVQAMAQTPAITRYQSLLRLASKEDAQAWVQDLMGYNSAQPREAYNLMMVERSMGTSMGWIGWGNASEPEFGDLSFRYALLPAFWGQGYMTEALRAALDFIFRTMGAQQIADYCETSNGASARVMEKAGLREVRRWMEATAAGEVVEYIRYIISRDLWLAQQGASTGGRP